MVLVACLNCVERVPLGEPGIRLLAPIDDGAITVLLEIFRGLGAIVGFGGICGGVEV